MMELERMLRGHRDRDEDEDTRLPEAVISDLKEMAKDYATILSGDCPFKAGDVVTPKVGWGTKGAGQPHIVLEVRRSFVLDEAQQFQQAPEPRFIDETGSNQNGKRLDMRIGSFSGSDKRFMHWVESVEFEDYLAAEKRKLDRTSAALKAA